MATAKKTSPATTRRRKPPATKKVTPAARTVQTPAPAAVTIPLAAIAVPVTKPDKPKKLKLVRDSFTIPKPEYAVLAELKLRALQAGVLAKKSELLRAGIKALAAMSNVALLASLEAVPAIKTGRPAKG